MGQRLAGCMALVAFMFCVIAGINVGNPFGTVVTRALLAMLATFVIGLVIGSMAQKMLDENIKFEEQKAKNDAIQISEDGR